MNLLKIYEEYSQQYGDENGVIEKRSKKWKEYKRKGITVDYVFHPYDGWLTKVLTNSENLSWSDHLRMVFIDENHALITLEPYYLSKEDVSELIKSGNELGFNVSLNNRFASHVAETGHCLEIAPLNWIENQIELDACL